MAAWWQILRELPKSGYSQQNEQSILSSVFANIGETTRFLVDLGAADGVWLSNTRYFIEQGWKGCLLDGGHQTADVNMAWITAGNIVELLEARSVPSTFDLLSIDLDGQDYWVLKSVLERYHPRVIVAEYNGIFSEHECKTVPLDPNFRFKDNDHHGASYGALKKLAQSHGYRTLCHNGLNVFRAP